LRTALHSPIGSPRSEEVEVVEDILQPDHKLLDRLAGAKCYILVLPVAHLRLCLTAACTAELHRLEVFPRCLRVVLRGERVHHL
jgi:hypothetical protein